MLAKKIMPDIEQAKKDAEEKKAAQEQRAAEFANTHNYGDIEIPEINGTAGLPATGIQKTITPKEKTNWIEKQTEKAVENAAAPAVTAQGGETLATADELGKAANQTIQNAEVPKWKRMTLNDIMFNPEYEGIRDSIASQAVNARSANFLRGFSGKDAAYSSAIDNFNNQQAQRYSDAIADRDTRALDAQLQADEAANKRDVGAELQRADTYLGRELDRWGLLYDTETKKQVLSQMVQDSKEFERLVPDPQDRLMLTAYQQYLSGDATALDSFLSTYGVDLAEKLDGLYKKVVNYFGGNNGTEYPDIVIGDTTYTPAQVENLGWEGIDNLIKNMPYEDQISVVENIEKDYGVSKDTRKLRDAVEKRNTNAGLEAQYLEEQKKATDTRADTINTQIEDILNSKYDEKKKRDKLIKLQNELTQAEGNKDFVDTQKMQETRAKLEAEVQKANLAVEVTSINSPLQGNVKLKIKDGVLDTKDADSSLEYLAKLNWNTLINKNTQSITDRQQKLDAVQGTKGYTDVVDFLSNPKVRDYAISNDAAAKNYKYAVNSFTTTFGGQPSDYNFLNVKW